MRQAAFLDAEIAAVERLIARAALVSPEIRRLMTVPGVNVIVAASFLAAIGDIRRFPSPRKLAGYLGLDPRVRQSGAGPATHGHISKQGSVRARHALVEASWSSVRQPGPTRAFYQRVRARRGSPDRDRRRGAQARVSVLVPAHARGGLRVRPAVVDAQEAAPPRADRRRRQPPRHQERPLGHQRRDAPSRARTGSPGRNRLPTHGPRMARRARRESGRERDTGARIKQARKGQSRAAEHKPLTSALRYVSHSRPPATLTTRPPPSRPLDFHPSSQADVSGVRAEMFAHRAVGKAAPSVAVALG